MNCLWLLVFAGLAGLASCNAAGPAGGLDSAGGKGHTAMTHSVATFLMFEGSAEQAMNLYVSLFRGSEIVRVERWGPGEQGKEGTFKKADFRLAGHEMICFDSPGKHAFTFTPSISLFVECEDEAELEKAYKELSAGGEVLMPLDNYGFSRKFGWVKDRFGVSWQLNLR